MRSIVAWLVVCVGAVSSVRATEVMQWDRLPLPVSLLVDQERVVFIDRPVRVGLPAPLAQSLRVQSAGGALYLRANAPFEPIRIQLQDTQTGALILLDVSARPAGADQRSLEPLRIVDANTVHTDDRPALAPSQARRPVEGTNRPSATPVPVVLTRYAAQSLYAPLRTIEAVQGITRVPIRADLALDSLLPSLPVQAHALIAWRLENDWVTAIKLRNRAPYWITFDPRALQGDFVAATFQHANVGPAGQPADTTVLYVVTRGHGIAEALLPAIAPVDPAATMPSSQTHAQ
jgi:integrating conjugative element protein (TIGR03749 family)